MIMNCTQTFNDVIDTSSANAIYVLAGINPIVLILGFYALSLEVNLGKIMFRQTVFYIFALSCLMVDEVYFLSSLWDG